MVKMNNFLDNKNFINTLYKLDQLKLANLIMKNSWMDAPEADKLAEAIIESNIYENKS